jgi:hypothetical protein
MKLISFDIGIKNMAYCVFDCSLSINVLEWNVLNLLEIEQPKQICNCFLKQKTKKSPLIKCNKIAKYKKNGVFYCEKHAKDCSQFMIPKKHFSIATIKKMKIEELIKLGNSHLAFMNIENLTTNPINWKRAILVDFLIKFFEKNSLEPIKIEKSKTAGETDLIKIGRSMKLQLDNIDFIGLTNVVIENQISPIANRMKTIQGMLAQYFIIKSSDAEIDFVSSANKLKQFGVIDSDKKRPKEPKKESPLENHFESSNPNPEYKQHKKDGVFYCSKMIETNSELESWKGSLDIKKKDDLADCFLQGIWFLKHKNIISFADDLKINII